jgi:hypothetical protein
VLSLAHLSFRLVFLHWSEGQGSKHAHGDTSMPGQR